MLIEGPMNIAIGDAADGQGKVLLITFKPEFQALGLRERTTGWHTYLQGLQRDVAEVADPNDHNRAGMMIIAQFAAELLPHIEADEIPLDQSIVLQVRREQAVALADLLGGIKG